MTSVELLCAAKDRVVAATKDLLLPVRLQEEDEEEPKPRAATIFLTTLPEVKKVEKKAPYILLTVNEGRSRYTDHHDGFGGRDPQRHLVHTLELRGVLCVYAKDRQEGGLYLLELMDRVRMDLERQPILGAYQIDLDVGMEWPVYDSDEWDLGNYHVGGMIVPLLTRTGPRPEVTEILRGDKDPGRIPGLYSETKKFLQGGMDHGE